MPLPWANLLLTGIFLLPHLLVLRVMPELVDPAAGLRRRADRGVDPDPIRFDRRPWLIHAVMNIGTCLMVAVRTAV